MQAASHAEERNDRFAGMTDEEIVRIAQDEHDGKAADISSTSIATSSNPKPAPTSWSAPIGMTSSRKA